MQIQEKGKLISNLKLILALKSSPGSWVQRCQTCTVPRKKRLTMLTGIIAFIKLRQSHHPEDFAVKALPAAEPGRNRARSVRQASGGGDGCREDD